MTKEDVINILNQHGVDALCSVIKNELDIVSNIGYDRGYRVGYNDGLNHNWCRYRER